MGTLVLDAGCSISCPHGGRATVMPGNHRVKVGGQFALLLNDNMLITGCSFNVSGNPMPCIRLQWQAPAARDKVNGTAVLLQASVAQCLNAAGAPQGSAVITGMQTRVKGA